MADWGTVEVTENLFRPIDEVVDRGNLRIRVKWILDLDKYTIRIIAIYYYYDLIENQISLAECLVLNKSVKSLYLSSQSYFTAQIDREIVGVWKSLPWFLPNNYAIA